MKISFQKKYVDNDHLVIVLINCSKIKDSKHLNNEQKSIINDFSKINNKSTEFIDILHHRSRGSLKSITVAKIENVEKEFKDSQLEAFGGRILSFLEKKK